MLNLFSPHGSNPLGNVKLSNQRCAKVDFDRTVKSNVLTLEGDLTQSKMSLPREDRPVASLQLIHPLMCLQLWIPSSGQFMLELGVSHSSVAKMKLSCGTHISKPDVHDVKGIAHVKLPLAIPRGSWTQVVFHVPGIFTHLFGLPQVRWVDTVSISGNVRLKRILVTSEEQLALESRPPGMLLYTLPAYGPPLWSGKCGVAQTEKSPAEDAVAPTSPAGKSTEPPTNNGGIKMRFVRGDDGKVKFTATSDEMERQKAREEEEQREQQLLLAAKLEAEERQKMREEEIHRIQRDQRDYMRLIESPTNAPPPTQPRVGIIPPKKTRPPTEQSPLSLVEDSIPMGWGGEEDEVPLVGPSSTSAQEAKPSRQPSTAAGARPRPLVSRRTSSLAAEASGAVSPAKKVKKKKPKIASLVHLNLEEPGSVHPADTYDPQGKEERPMGFGVGCLDVIECGTPPDNQGLEPYSREQQSPQRPTPTRPLSYLAQQRQKREALAAKKKALLFDDGEEDEEE